MVLTVLTAAATAAACTAVRWFLERSSRRPTEHLGGRVRVEALYNSGAAFGGRRLRGRGLLAASAAALVLALGMGRRRGSALGTGLVLGGGGSNLLERAGRGRVFDYVRFPRAPGRWRRYVFNLADLAIFLGAALMLARRKKR